LIFEKLWSLYIELKKANLTRSSQLFTMLQDIKLLEQRLHIAQMSLKRKIYDIVRHLDRLKEELKVERGLSTKEIE